MPSYYANRVVKQAETITRHAKVTALRILRNVLLGSQWDNLAVAAKVDSRDVVAARLERVREFYGIETRREFATRAGIREQDYSDWMNLRRNVPTAAAMKLCATYSLTWEFIYLGNKDHLEHRMAIAL